MSRLRLAAGCALLKLAQEQAFTEFISLEQFQLIALLINVSHILLLLINDHFEVVFE